MQCSIGAIASRLNVSSALAGLEHATTTDVATGEAQDLLTVIDVREQFRGRNVSQRSNYAAAIEPGAGRLFDYSVGDEILAAVNARMNTKCRIN